MTGTADPIADQFHPEYAGKLGAGRINAYAALSSLQSGISNPNLVYYGRDIDDPGGDTFWNAGEEIDLRIFLKNFWEDAFNVTATLTSTDSLITVVSGNTSYGTILNGEAAINSTPFVVVADENTLPGEYVLIMNIESGQYEKEFTFYLHIYSKISSGFPISLEDVIWPTSIPKITDLDGDGNNEMIVLSKAGTIYRVDGSGQFTAIYSLPTQEEFWASPALGDLDSDGDLEIVCASYNTTSWIGKLYIIHHDGSDFSANFPKTFANNLFRSSPLLADLDNDNDLEIIIGGEPPEPWTAQNLFCLEADGSLKWEAAAGLPFIYFSPAIGDYNSDGNIDIICIPGVANPGVALFAKLLIYQGSNGEILADVNLSGGITSYPIIGDLNNDGFLDTIFELFNGESVSYVLDGATLQDIWNSGVKVWGSPAATPISDMADKEGLEFLLADNRMVKLHDYEGSILYSNEAVYRPSYILIGDLNNNGNQEVLSTASFALGPIPPHDWLIYLETFDDKLDNSPDFLMQSIKDVGMPSPIINDFDNDGITDISLIYGNGDIYCYPLNSPYKHNQHHWPEAQRDMFNSKRYDPPALSGELNEDSDWTGIVRVSGDITVPAGITLDIEPGTKVIFQHGDDEKGGTDPTLPELIVNGTLNANGAENNRIEFFSYSRWYGIVAKTDAELNLDYCWIDKAEKGIEIKPAHLLYVNHEISNCEISRCNYGIHITSNSANIQYNQIHHNNIGIYLFESEYTIYENDVDSCRDHGIYLSNSSDGYITNNRIYSNSSTEADVPFAGVLLYQSSPYMLANQIYSNWRNGIALIDKSFPVILESNLIAENGPVDPLTEPAWDKAEILMQDICSPYMDYGHNDIVDKRADGYLMMHSGEVDELILVNGNYWGGDSPEGLLYPGEYYYYEDWDEEPNTSGIPEQMSVEEELLISALQAEQQGDYNSARNGYQQIVSTYPDSVETAYSLPRLFVCEQALGGDFTQLQAYYLNFTQNNSDSINCKIAEGLARRCLVQQRLLNNAIVEYENVVQAPPSLADSVYAVIDIGDIYLLQDELNTGPNPRTSAIGGSSAAP